jgi:hypothetical protein
MSSANDRNDQLERLVKRALRDQPPRQAPLELEARVRAEIERRAVAPWWRKSFVYWPAPARALYLAASIGCVYLGFRAVMWLLASFNPAAFTFHLPPEVTWIHTVLAAIVMVVSDIPSLWIYGALAAIGALYATVFGIGATAYRTLYASR